MRYAPACLAVVACLLQDVGCHCWLVQQCRTTGDATLLGKPGTDRRLVVAPTQAEWTGYYTSRAKMRKARPSRGSGRADPEDSTESRAGAWAKDGDNFAG